MRGKILWIFLIVFGFFAKISVAEDFSGKYEGANLSVEINSDGSAYAGQIHLGKNVYPLKAQEESGHLKGTFTSDGNNFDFTADRQGDGMTLLTGGTTFTLKKINSAANPLAAAQPANPLTQVAAVADAPEGYAVVAATDVGKAMSIRKAKVDSVKEALQATLPDLAKYFGAKPTITSAFEDSKDEDSGGASFTANYKGQPIKGFISCKVDDEGATVAVIYCKADATPADWSKLTSAPANADNNQTDHPAATGEIRLQEYRFPDDTGSVGIAEGWKTNAQSCMGGVTITGPADQTATLGFSLSIVTPDSMAVQTQRQLAMNARQWGMPPPPPMQLLVAPFTAPAEAVANLVPQISQMSQRNGGPALAADHIVQVQQVQPMLQGGSAAIITFDSTKTINGNQKHYKNLLRAESDPVGQGAWMLYATQLQAPDETYQRDLPVMLAMMNSQRTNDQVIAQKTNQNIQASNQRFAVQQQSHKDLMDTYDRYNKSMERNSIIRSRSNADFDEVIRGYRTVEDTTTGEKTSVDLGNVDKIVDNLNQGDPGRYKQIPLRDETNPLPPDK